MASKRPLFEASGDVKILQAELAKVKPGDSVGYAVLSKALGKPVSGRSDPLQKAKKALLRDGGYVFSPIRGLAVYRLRDEEIVTNADRHLTHIKRTARLGVREITAVKEYEKMSRAKQLAHTVRLSVMTALAAISSEKSLSKIEASVTSGTRELPIAETLAAFLAPPAI